MNHGRTLQVAVIALIALATSSCGGDGLKGFRSDTTPLSITSNVISEPANGTDTNTLFESADAIDFEIPLAGGCSGSYVMSILSGRLPDGVGLADSVTFPGSALHHLRGNILEAGHFAFRLQVVDKSCEPFLSTYADFAWDVVVGDLQIVGATIQGDNAFFRKGTYVRNGVVVNPDYGALKSVVYNAFSVIDITVAGGVKPYTCQIVDDPTNPKDGNLPTGTLIAPATTSIVGSPTPPSSQVALPFLFTVEATDSQGRTARMTVQWQIDTPAIIIANTSLPDAKCGLGYGETIVIVDGVPPFVYELVQTDVSRNALGEPVVDYGVFPPAPTPATAGIAVSAADYPAQTNSGPDYRSFAVPPEGMYLGNVTTSYSSIGSLTGIPRRRGQFHLNFHVASTTLASVKGQQAWRTYEFQAFDSEPPDLGRPAFGQNPAYTVAGVFTATQPYASIPDAELGLPYNPDAATHPGAGLRLLAVGGVTKDGRTDGPHASQITLIDGLGSGQENPGDYDWTANWNPPGDGDPYTALPGGMAFDGWIGILRTDGSTLVRQGNQAVQFAVADQQLPVSARHAQTQTVNFSIGPDRAVILESTASATGTYLGGPSLDDQAQTVRVLEPLQSGMNVRDLQSGDLCLTTSVPATTGGASLATLLSTVDFLRITVPPTGWWDDSFGLNPNGLREMQNGDANKSYSYYSNAMYQYGGFNTCATGITLPPCSSSVVTANAANGIYKDGGKLYAFTSATYFGIFVVRNDGSIFVPTAFKKGSGTNVYNAFGDGIMAAYGAITPGLMRTVQMVASPDGRFAAMKLKTTETTWGETANTTKIVIFSLTGERPFSGASYKVIDTGSNGSTTLGTYLYAPSLALTNGNLYYLCGNFIGTAYSDSSGAPHSQWHGHFIYRYQITNSAGAVTASATAGALLTPAVTNANWTLASNVPMQTAFQKWNNGTYSTTFYDYGQAAGTSYTGLVPFYYDEYAHDGMNLVEYGCARRPFRVSKSGKVMVILAGSDPGSAITSSTDINNFFVWADYDGLGVRQVSTLKRHYNEGASRGTTLAHGPDYYPHYLRWGGPTTALEISDDGNTIAAVVNRWASTVTLLTTVPEWWQGRQDVQAWKTTDNWTSRVEIQVTGDDAGTNRIFGGASTSWRFGALTFTADNKGLVFWGGMSSFYGTPSSSAYSDSQQMCGTFYACNLTAATGGTTGVNVYGILPTADGGSGAGITSSPYTTSNQYNPTPPAGAYTVPMGTIKPCGGFISNNRNFLYVDTWGAINSSEQTNFRLIGVNIRSVDATQSINGKPDSRAFAVTPWPSRRGWNWEYNIYPYYGLYYAYYVGGNRSNGCGMQVMASNGTVYFGTIYQYSGPGNNTSYSYGGPPLPCYYTYGYWYGGEVHAMAADVGGGPVKLSTFNSDAVSRIIHWVQPSRNGEDVAFVYDGYQLYYPGLGSEQLTAIKDVRFAADGTLASVPKVLNIEGGVGRAGEAMSFNFSRDKLYYGFRAGSTDENQKDLVEARVDPVTSAITYRKVTTSKRYSVLHCGR